MYAAHFGLREPPFAITPDPFIVFTSNIFAILGLRALYFCLAALIAKFRYLKPALILILAFVGVKLLLLAGPKLARCSMMSE